MALLGNAKPTPEQLAEFRKNAGKGRIWIYQNLEPGHADWGKLIFLQKPYAPPAQVTDPFDGTTWRYRLVGYILDLKTGEIGECRSTMTPGPPPAPRKPNRKVIEGPWEKRTIEPPKESETPKAPPSGQGRHTDYGLAKPDDPIYSSGPIVNGRELTGKKPGTYTRGGFLPPDHWLYSAEPIVSGRPILQSPKRKPSENSCPTTGPPEGAPGSFLPTRPATRREHSRDGGVGNSHAYYNHSSSSINPCRIPGM